MSGNAKKKIDDFATDFDKIDAIVSKIMGRMTPAMGEECKPVVFGFSMRLDNSGNPVVEEFGNANSKEETFFLGNPSEPLVDVRESEKSVLIVAELPGVEKKDLKIVVPDAHTVEVTVSGKNPFYRKVSLTSEIVREKASAKMKNGILELLFERKDFFPTGNEMKID